VAGAYGLALGRAERFLSLFRKSIHIHRILPISAIYQRIRTVLPPDR
jgi:hypothetical protein